jgi:hypothetical protein
LLYPTLRVNKSWYVGSATQTATESFFYEGFDEGEYDLRMDVLQAFLAYERYSGRNMIRFKAGEMSTAFGSYTLDYDDARNPLIDIPAGYGYYYSPVSTLGFTGAEIDEIVNRFDLRIQAPQALQATGAGPPPNRPTKSPRDPRVQPRRRAAAADNSWSPTRWPKLSLTVSRQV